MSSWILRKTEKDHRQIFRKIDNGGYDDDAAVANKKCGLSVGAGVCLLLLLYAVCLYAIMTDSRFWRWMMMWMTMLVAPLGSSDTGQRRKQLQWLVEVTCWRESYAEISVTPAGCTTSKHKKQLSSKFWYGCPFIWFNHKPHSPLTQQQPCKVVCATRIQMDQHEKEIGHRQIRDFRLQSMLTTQHNT